MLSFICDIHTIFKFVLQKICYQNDDFFMYQRIGGNNLLLDNWVTLCRLGLDAAAIYGKLNRIDGLNWWSLFPKPNVNLHQLENLKTSPKNLQFQYFSLVTFLSNDIFQ